MLEILCRSVHICGKRNGVNFSGQQPTSLVWSFALPDLPENSDHWYLKIKRLIPIQCNLHPFFMERGCKSLMAKFYSKFTGNGCSRQKVSQWSRITQLKLDLRYLAGGAEEASLYISSAMYCFWVIFKKGTNQGPLLWDKEGQREQCR